MTRLQAPDSPDGAWLFNTRRHPDPVEEVLSFPCIRSHNAISTFEAVMKSIFSNGQVALLSHHQSPVSYTLTTLPTHLPLWILVVGAAAYNIKINS